MIAAGSEIKNLEAVIKEYRANVDEEFSLLFSNILKFGEKNNIDPTVPRTCRRQTARSNVPAASPEEYDRRSIFIPFLDFLLSEIKARFGSLFSKLAAIQVFIPAFLNKIQESDALKRLDQIQEPDVNTDLLSLEFKRWKTYWQTQNKTPQTAAESLAACDSLFYPNIKILLKILCVMPVTTAEAERSFSTLRRLKTWLRSTTSENRLTGLALLHIHNYRTIDQDVIITRYANSGNRRLELIFNR